MSEQKQRFVIDLSLDLHRRFKLHCVANRLSMATVIRELIEGYLAKTLKKQKR